MKIPLVAARPHPQSVRRDLMLSRSGSDAPFSIEVSPIGMLTAIHGLIRKSDSTSGTKRYLVPIRI